jgi:hypothetical protein
MSSDRGSSSSLHRRDTMAAWLFAASLIAAFLSWGVAPAPLFVATVIGTFVVMRRVFGFPVLLPAFTGLFVAVSYLAVWGDTYKYTHPLLSWNDLPLFPLLAWPYGLTLVLFWSGRLAKLLGVTSRAGRIAVGYLVFAPSLVAVEWVGYQYCDIRLVTHYPGLLGLECMHIPPALTAVYFANGLIYLVLTIAVLEPILERFSALRLAEPASVEVERDS